MRIGYGYSHMKKGQEAVIGADNLRITWRGVGDHKSPMCALQNGGVRG
jgi:hypothetical protein